MLKKIVDGKEVILSEQEEKNFRAWWELNKKYPDYQGSFGFDGVNPPFHDLSECKKKHIKLVNEAAEKKISSLNTLIDMAREDGDAASETKLLTDRKKIRSYMNPDPSSAKTIDDLVAMFPSDLQP